VSAAHNPTSNLKLGSGIAPVPAMLDAGINIALGTDGAASNNNLNMFEEMHLSALIHKGIGQNPELVTARQALAMATVNGSNAIGFGNDTGVIKPGMKADLILIDTDKPHLSPLNDPYSAVVYSAQGSDVDTVIVDGDILMENRELKTIDEERVKYEAAAASKRLMS
jgi:5-methylthioadenosine/S-adenosylhomocysteine deaminase